MFSEDFSKFVDARMIFNELRTAPRFSFKVWQEKVNKLKVSQDVLFSSLDKENLIMFIEKTLRSKTVNLQLWQGWIPYVTEKIYEFNLKFSDLTLNATSRNTVRTNLERLLDAEAVRLLGETYIDEYHLKLVGYAWEMCLPTDAIAEKYDQLINEQRLEKLSRLMEYFKMRALNRYANMGGSHFEEKSRAYGIHKSRDEFREYVRPNLQRIGAERREEPVAETIIQKDGVIDGFNFELKASRRQIWISNNGHDLATITKGQITIEDELSVQQKGNSLTLAPGFDVFVKSELETVIVSKGKRYRIVFK